MAFFEKKSTVFRKQDKAGWLSAKEMLKTAGIRGIRAGRYDVEPPVCGCGAKLDPRNFGAKGPIDRSMYFIEVPVKEVERARALLSVSETYRSYEKTLLRWKAVFTCFAYG